jgi:hypothetical protein
LENLCRNSDETRTRWVFNERSVAHHGREGVAANSKIKRI